MIILALALVSPESDTDGVFFFFLYYSPFWVADLVRKRRQRAS